MLGKSKPVEAVGSLAPVIRVDIPATLLTPPEGRLLRNHGENKRQEKAVSFLSLLSKIHCQSSDITKPMILKNK